MKRNVTEKLVGLSLREPNYSDFINKEVDVNFLEVISENYFYTKGVRREDLIQLSEKYAIHLHGVSLNIGGFDEFDLKSISQLKELIRDTNPTLISDHLCFTRHNKKSTFDLLPFPLTKKMILHLKDRINEIHDLLGVNIVFENISTYFRFKIDEMDECEFLANLHDAANVNYLLDLNNLIVNQFNHNINPIQLIRNLPEKSVSGFHLAGYLDQESFLFDAHDSKVPKEVWQLYREAIKKFGAKPTILERDENIPTTSDLVKETKQALEIVNNVQ